MPCNALVERTDIGTFEFARIPIPSSPLLPAPQQNAAPDAIAHVKFPPDEIEVTILPARTPLVSTATGEEDDVLVPLPS